MDSAPKGLRWEQDGPLTARLRPRISRLYFCLFGAVWNFALGPGHVLGAALHHASGSQAFDLVGLGGGLLFLLLAAREAGLVSRVAFESGNLVVRVSLAPWARLEIPQVEIKSFEVVQNEDATYRVLVRTHAGADRKVPLNFETVPVRGNWNKKMLFAAPVTYASFIATRLTDMLDAAKRSGHDTYRA
jgi:hypothetical protein